MTKVLVCLRVLAVIVAFSLSPPVEADLGSQVEIVVLDLPQSLESASANWCIWGTCTMGPRLYHEPRTGGGWFVGWSDASGSGHVSIVSEAAIQTTHDFGGSKIRGLVGHADNGYAVLLWNRTASTMRLSKRNAAGGALWFADLNHTSPVTVFDNNVGDSRLAYGGGKYGAYYSVHCVSGWCAGHKGDQYKQVTDNGTVSTQWDWGCSHSMASLLAYHPAWGTLMPLCSSDCYLSKGLMANLTRTIFAADANCGGLVGLQLGQMAAGDTAWKVIFTALDANCCDAHGIGLASFDQSYQATTVWLTQTDGSYERDPVMARLPDIAGQERYLVGWRTTHDGDFHLGIIDGNGAYLEGPESVGASGIQWNQRDDSFRSNPDGSVTWVSGAPGSTTLRLYRYGWEPPFFADGFEAGDTSAWQ